MNKNIKVGYLPFYIKLYDDSNPRSRDSGVAYMRKLVGMLEDQGLDIVLPDDICRIKPEFDAAVAKFQAAGVQAVITQHIAYSPSLESIGALLQLDVPIVVFDTTPDYEYFSVAKQFHRVGDNHGIHGVQDMCNLLKRNGRPYYICAGHAEHSDVVQRVAGMCRAAAAAGAFRTMQVGSVGGSFTGMGDFAISDARYKADIGAQVHYMTPEVSAAYLAKVTEEEIDAEIAADRSRFEVVVENEENYRLATKSGLALRKWMQEKQLGAASVNFLTLDICGLPKMPFAECCKIMERGLGYAGEGDVLTAGLVGALHAYYPDTTFTEMFCPDWENDMLMLSHMGESNPTLSQWQPRITDKPFNYNSCGDTVAMYTCFRPGKAAIVNLAPMEDSFTMIVTEGELLPGQKDNIYIDTNQGWFKPCKPLPQFLEEYSMAGGTHHSAMVYGADVRELIAFGKMMGFQVVHIA